MSQLTPAQEKDLKYAFDLFDKDKSGSISIQELKSVYNKLEIGVSDSEIRNAMKQMDTDNSGEISFGEFKRYMAAKYFRKPTIDEIRAAFKSFDLDNSGYLTADELRLACSKMGRQFNKDEIEKIIRTIDKDGDGRISITEFSKLLN